MYHVYIIESKELKQYYIGYTKDLEKRLCYHNGGLNRSTKKTKDWLFVYKEEYKTKTEALKREIFLKKQRNKEFYKRLIEAFKQSGRSSDG